jgi:hypothetical protein
MVSKSVFDLTSLGEVGGVNRAVVLIGGGCRAQSSFNVVARDIGDRGGELIVRPREGLLGKTGGRECL